MKTSIRQFLHEEDGITALEYGILAALVAAALAAMFYPKLKALYETLFGDMTTAVGNASNPSS